MNSFQTTTAQANKPPTNDEKQSRAFARKQSRREWLQTNWPRWNLLPNERRETCLGMAARDGIGCLGKSGLPTPLELVLAEVWGVRYALLSLFHAGAQATAEGKPLLANSVLTIRDRADARKLEQARQMLADFVSRPAKGQGKDGGEKR